MKSFEKSKEELQRLLELSRQYWLLGAGVSLESGIPLMYPLTARVKDCLSADERTMFQRMADDLPQDAHVEHILSHLGDLIAVAERSRSKTCRVGENVVAVADLDVAYKCIIKAIAETVRYGYRPQSGHVAEQIGTPSAPLVEVDHHRNFIHQLFKGRANLEPRSQISFVTTNYDTLIEDALALERRVALDGFRGGSIAYWDGDSIDPGHSHPNYSHRVMKLHGSVDWFRDASAGLLRVRYGVKYLADLAGTLIYPQATKYVETQRDPFARIFDCFRRSLRAKDNHLLAIVGYSFGDSHINAEIEAALAESSNKTVVVAFSKEVPVADDQTALSPVLQDWLSNPRFRHKIHVATDKAIYSVNGRIAPSGGPQLGWWTFSGVTKFLESGAAL
jgi:hypothetical protein